MRETRDERNAKRVDARRTLLGVGATLFSSTSYGLSTIVAKVGYRLELQPMDVLALQSWFASAILLFGALLFKRVVFRLPPRTFAVLAFQGICGSFATGVLFYNSLRLLPVPVAMVLLYTYPVIVLGASVLLWRRKVTKKQVLAVGLTLAGAVSASGILSAQVTVTLIGLAVGIGSAVSYATMNLAAEVSTRHVSPLTVMAYCQWFSGLGVLAYFKGDVLALPWQLPEVWLIGLWMGVFSAIVPYYLLMVGIKYIGSDKAAILSTFELPVTYVFALLILREVPTVGEWIGGTLIMAAIILLNWRRNNEGQRAVD